ncbi:CMGC/SRPK protein kinase [Pochonia chlamydosporia 170]|uniref:non-specific serine/threonine protein kinase n=1 Tax=Pochonia chlamydosporia 170 TaxID=1380566 RepID=A0A179G6E0_METCM|nr:CMGC/SRPK protein kinase [Pochonia chlamydosporia 170]OAQ73078.1 CMGC/SRPK protein kinase [Pochonia chlamydosporia 170]
MASFLRRLALPGRTWQPLSFSNPNFTRIPSTEKIEEELFPDYIASRYYPARIGEVLRDQYQIVGKLGFGASSTVWLARDLLGRRHVALKLFINAKSLGGQLDHELTMYKRISASSPKHPGRGAVRELLDSFDVAGPDGCHRCLVHPPLWESVLTFLRRNPVMRLPAPVLVFVLRRLFLALDFLHSECRIIHTDIKADNIMFGVNDDSVFSAFEGQELRDPSPRKEVDGRVVYTSRELQMPKNWGAPVLCDFGSAVAGDVEHFEDVQPDIYRAPEVILEAPWSYEVDIWNTGCMIWDLFEGQHLFTGFDPEHQTYRSRAHLAEITGLLGQPSQALLRAGRSSHKFFTEKGDLRADIPLPDSISLEEKETSLEGESREKFLAMMRKILQWEPSRRSSAKALADDEWIMGNM